MSPTNATTTEGTGNDIGGGGGAPYGGFNPEGPPGTGGRD